MWQPIETAPKDQTFLAVLNCAGQQTICTMRWAVAEEKNSRPDHDVFHVERVTHWMPLPDLPGAQPAPSAPDGWKLVPIEPTYEMLEAGEGALVPTYTDTPVSVPDDVYRAMLAAAPEAKP
jgi:hypothetical protein